MAFALRNVVHFHNRFSAAEKRRQMGPVLIAQMLITSAEQHLTERSEPVLSCAGRSDDVERRERFEQQLCRPRQGATYVSDLGRGFRSGHERAKDACSFGFAI